MTVNLSNRIMDIENRLDAPEVWDLQMQTGIYRTDKQGSTV